MMKKTEYVVYDWKGKVEWAMIGGIYLVDPESQEEFLSSNPTAIMLGGK